MVDVRGARDPEVRDERHTVREQDVLGLDVTVDEPPMMGVPECTRDLPPKS